MCNRIIQVLFLFSFLFVIFSSKANAAVIFQDNFNGSGELSSYNASYQLVNDFHPNTGTFNVINDHVETSGYDPGYVYTGIEGDHVCASIDFNWLGKPSNGANGGWTNLLVHTTPDRFGIGVQIRSDNPSFQTWVVYNSDTDPDAPFIYNYGIISFDLSLTHTLKACIEGQKITGFLDNVQLFTYYDTYYPSGFVGFASQVPTYYLDNFKVEAIGNNLNVPLIKQTSAPWGSQVYDSANLWAGNKNDIARWGCALTSAAMVFQYHGVNKMPDNTNLDPGTLNTWLKSQPDGYIRNGLVNWLALSRLSLLAKGNNNYDNFDALEFNKINSTNKSQLSQDLSNAIPGILEEPGHFIVAKGEDVDNNTFLINDPYYPKELLTDYGNTFSSLNRFVPSNTDLSYLMFVVDKDINIKLKDGNGNEVGESYIQNPIDNPLNDSQKPEAVKILYFPKPESGDYTIEVNATDIANYNLDGYLYDKDGNVKKIVFSGIVGNGDTDVYKVNQDSENINNGNIKQDITFDTLIADIELLYKAGKIKNFGLYTAWKTEANQAKFLSGFFKKGAGAILKTLSNQISRERRAIDNDSKSILLNDISIISSSL